MMRFRFKYAGVVLPLLLTAASHAQVQVVSSLITTLAGGGTGCAGQTDSIGDGCPSADSALRVPTGDAVDSLGNLYIADANDGVIRKVSAATGEITTVAGTVSSSGFSGDNGPATSATFSTPYAVAVDAAGDLFIVDQGNVRIREVSAATGDINTIAGDGSTGYTGDNGQATSATLKNPSGIAVNPAGTLVYIADSGNNSALES
jgi:trimeric autotransporter adhesin